MSQLLRAHEEELLYKHPKEIVHFEDTSEAAVLWIEQFLADPENINRGEEVKKRSSVLKRAESNISGNAISPWARMASFFGDATREESEWSQMPSNRFNSIIVFAVGIAVGVVLGTKRSK